LGKSLETSKKKSLDSFDEIDEINWKSQNNVQRTQEELDSIRDLLESEPEMSSGTLTPSSWDLTEETRKRDEERRLSQILGGRYSGIGFNRFRPF